MKAKDLLGLKEELGEKQAEQSRLEGQIEQVNKDLKEKFEVESEEAGKEKLEKMGEEIKALEEQVQEQCDLIEEEYAELQG